MDTSYLNIVSHRIPTQIISQILKLDSEVAQIYGKFIILTNLFFSDTTNSSEYIISEDETSEL
jgi:hypothetical protein